MPASASTRRLLLATRGVSLVALTLAALGVPQAARASSGPLCYVQTTATPPGDGTSWGTAYVDLQDARANVSCAEIWVAAGTYVPGTSRVDTFALSSGVAIYGGFAGTETLRSERDSEVNVTVLDGDIGAKGDPSDNC